VFDRVNAFGQNAGASSAEQVCGTTTFEMRTPFDLLNYPEGGRVSIRHKFQNAPAYPMPVI
jgi:hypothetical protein